MGTASWTGRGFAREVFNFPSGHFELYGSLYTTDRPTYGVVICPAWGVEARRGEPLCRSLALEIAKRRGAALVFDWPGQGESNGESESVRLEDLVDAAVAAATQINPLITGGELTLSGFRLGAAVAALAAEKVGAGALALLQPVWDPREHFNSVRKASARASLGNGTANGLAFGFPFPSLGSFDESGQLVTDALQSFTGRFAAFGYGAETPRNLNVEAVEFNGDWRQSIAHGDRRLIDAALSWVTSAAGAL